MSGMLSQKNVKLAVLVLLASFVVVVAARSLFGLSQYPVRQGKLRNYVASSPQSKVFSLRSAYSWRRPYCSTKQTIASRSGLRSFKRLAAQRS